eukprot:g3366.t1
MSEVKYSAPDACTNCGPDRGRPVLDYAQGDCVCSRCGLVLCSRIIDERSETRYFADEGAPAPPVERYNGGSRAQGLIRGGAMATTVLGATMVRGCARRGVRTSGGGRSARKLHAAVMGGKDDALLSRVVEQFDALCARLSLPDRVSQRCQVLFSRCRKCGSMGTAGGCSVGARGSALVPALVYVACREGGITRSLREVALAAQASGFGPRVSKKLIGRSVLAVSRKLELVLGAASAEEFIPRFVSSLEALETRAAVNATAEHGIRQAEHQTGAGGEHGGHGGHSERGEQGAQGAHAGGRAEHVGRKGLQRYTRAGLAAAAKGTGGGGAGGGAGSGAGGGVIAAGPVLTRQAQAALEVAHAATTLGVAAGRRPDALAAACLYFVVVSDGSLGWSAASARSRIAAATMVSEQSIRSIHAEQLLPARAQLLAQVSANA